MKLVAICYKTQVSYDNIFTLFCMIVVIRRCTEGILLYRLPNLPELSVRLYFFIAALIA